MKLALQAGKAALEAGLLGCSPMSCACSVWDEKAGRQIDPPGPRIQPQGVFLLKRYRPQKAAGLGESLISLHYEGTHFPPQEKSKQLISKSSSQWECFLIRFLMKPIKCKAPSPSVSCCCICHGCFLPGIVCAGQLPGGAVHIPRLFHIVLAIQCFL